MGISKTDPMFVRQWIKEASKSFSANRARRVGSDLFLKDDRQRQIWMSDSKPVNYGGTQEIHQRGGQENQKVHVKKIVNLKICKNYTRYVFVIK